MHVATTVLPPLQTWEIEVEVCEGEMVSMVRYGGIALQQTSKGVRWHVGYLQAFIEAAHKKLRKKSAHGTGSSDQLPHNPRFFHGILCILRLTIITLMIPDKSKALRLLQNERVVDGSEARGKEILVLTLK